MYDDCTAKREGWAIFACDDGILRLQRLDCPRDAFADLSLEAIFESDADAIDFVREKASAGSAMHVAALALHLTVSDWAKDHPIAARTPSGDLIDGWDERLRSAGCTPVYAQEIADIERANNGC